MSYNIQSLKVRTIELELPLTFDFQAWLREQGTDPGIRWCIENEDHVQANLAESTWRLSMSSSWQGISGVIEDGKLVAKEIDCFSDGSGHLYEDVIVPFFKQHNGVLEALIVWEDGEVYRHTIRDGKATSKEVEW